jgi:hypothetical protein
MLRLFSNGQIDVLSAPPPSILLLERACAVCLWDCVSAYIEDTKLRRSPFGAIDIRISQNKIFIFCSRDLTKDLNQHRLENLIQECFVLNILTLPKVVSYTPFKGEI